MDKGLKNTERIQVYIDSRLLEKLKYLHQQEGPMNYKTKKRRTFSIFIKKILSDHVRERITSIDFLSKSVEWSDKDFA